MSEDRIAEIFIQIAFKAMDTGKELKLEKGKNTSTNTLFGGAFSDIKTNHDSLILNVFQPGQEEAETEEDEEEEAEKE